MSPTIIDTDEEATWTRMLAWEATTSESPDGTMVREEILKDQNGEYLRWRAETGLALDSMSINEPPKAKISRLNEQELEEWYKAHYERENFKVILSDETIMRIGFNAGEPIYINLVPPSEETPWATDERYYPDEPTEIAAWLEDKQEQLNAELDAVKHQLRVDELEKDVVRAARREIGSLDRATNALKERHSVPESAAGRRQDAGGDHS